MKILVTGENSYAGRQFAKRIIELNKDWEVDFISVRNEEWRNKSFSMYNAVYHVAGIVHKKEKLINKSLYYKINRDLTYELALKAKNEGVKSFVFLSTLAVYGLTGIIGKDIIIFEGLEPAPTSSYGISKLEAEKLLDKLQSQEYKVASLRIPMVYGPGCPGNYIMLSNLAKKTPIFPKVNNKRSMIFIDHLSDLVIYVIEKNVSGVVLVQNPETVSTLEMVENISNVHNNRIYKSLILAKVIKIFGNRFNTVKKIFGSLYIDGNSKNISDFRYSDIRFKDSIILSEKKNSI